MSGITDSLKSEITHFLAQQDKQEEIAQKIASSIEKKELKLLDLVKSLGDYLTADDDAIRAKSLHCLSLVLDFMSKSILSKHDIDVLYQFFNSKFDDVKCLKEIMFGIDTLINMEEFAANDHLADILTKFSDVYNPKQHLASARFYSFKILESLLNKFESLILNDYNDEFVKAFLHIATGEKDPRNLLKSFDLNYRISKNFKIDEFKDDLFDDLFCYFPISFKPPKDDPYGVTSEQLKSSLRHAIGSNSLFDKDSYPNLLEKLTSISPSVKQDTLLTIKECLDSYGIESASENWLELWNALKFEILHGSANNGGEDDEFNNLSIVLSIFTSITIVLAQDEDRFNDFFTKLCDELLPNFSNNKHIKETVSIFGSISVANQKVYNRVCSKLLPLLLKDQNDLNVSKQSALINNLSVLTNSYIKVFGDSSNPEAVEDTSNVMLENKDTLLMFLGKSLMSSSKVEVNLRTLSINELTKLSQMVNFLTVEEIGIVVQYFTETVLDDDNQYVFDSAIGGLILISKSHNSILLEITFPLLLSLLPANFNDQIIFNDEIKPIDKIFNIITLISTTKETNDFIFIRLVNKLIEINGSAEKDESEDNGKYFYLICTTLFKTLTQTQKNKVIKTDDYLVKTTPKLIDLILGSNETSSIVATDDNLEVLTDLIKLIVVYSSKSLHKELLDETVAFFTNDETKLSTSQKYFKSLGKINMFNTQKQPTKLVNLFSKIVSAVDTKTEFTNVDEFISKLMHFLEDTEITDLYTKIGYLQTLAVIVNKWCLSSEFLLSYLSSSGSECDPRRIDVFTWISKGFVSKIDKNTDKLIDILISLLRSSTGLASRITKSFEVLIADISVLEKYKKISNNNVRLLYKQKFFEIISPKLVSSFKESSDEQFKSNLLIALSLILKHTKKEIIIPHLNEFFPLLLQSLALDNGNNSSIEIKLASLETILITIDEIPELISKHLQTIIPNLIQLIKINNFKLRLISINCLNLISMKVEIVKIMPYKDEIIKSLLQSLDDPKRVVRKAAVDARQSYYELGRNPIE